MPVAIDPGFTTLVELRKGVGWKGILDPGPIPGPCIALPAPIALVVVLVLVVVFVLIRVFGDVFVPVVKVCLVAVSL